jgi:hypothetical protein
VRPEVIGFISWHPSNRTIALWTSTACYRVSFISFTSSSNNKCPSSRWALDKEWHLKTPICLTVVPLTCLLVYFLKRLLKKTPWPESASELYQPSDHRLSAKILPTFADSGCHVARDGSLRPYSRLSRQEPLLFYQVAPQLYSRGWVDHVPDPLLLRKSGSAWNRTRTPGSVARNH